MIGNLQAFGANRIEFQKYEDRSGPAARRRREKTRRNLTMEDAARCATRCRRPLAVSALVGLLRRGDPRQERQPRGQHALRPGRGRVVPARRRPTTSATAASSRPRRSSTARSCRPGRRREGRDLPEGGPDGQGHHRQRPALPRRRRPREARGSSSAGRRTTRSCCRTGRSSTSSPFAAAEDGVNISVVPRGPKTSTT